MNSNQNSTGLAGGASHRRHMVDVVADMKNEIVCVRAMIEFARDAIDDCFSDLAKSRDIDRENDLIVAVYDIHGRMQEIEQAIDAALADYDHRVMS